MSKISRSVMWLTCGLMLLLGTLGAATADDRSVVVDTRSGRVRGTWSGRSRAGRSYAEFKGIPYAKPPIGSLRLQPPKPADPWTGIWDATTYRSHCIQPVSITDSRRSQVHGQEDCLYINVFTHDVSKKAPVIVHIHGGVWFWGRGNWYKPNYIMDEDVVVVNFNYRLGIFGFLTWETEELRGNQGLKDQVLALKWVQENIAAFGGDPHLVTINGDSAGSASVYYHTVSPLSKGLFHRAIAESGTSYGLWGLFPPGAARAQSHQLMQAINCPTETSAAIRCVMEMDAIELMQKVLNSSTNQSLSRSFNFYTPSLEPADLEAFISGPVSGWVHSTVPLLLGATSAEGLLFTMLLLQQHGPDLRWFSDWLDKEGPTDLRYKFSAPNPDEVTKKIKEYYFPKNEISMATIFNLTQVYSDLFFIVPILEGANKHGGDTYFYYFDYVNKNLPAGIDRRLLIGANHCAESAYVWDMTEKLKNMNLTLEFTQNEIELSKALVKLWVKFAKYGRPTFLPGKWKKWTETDQTYMEVDRSGEFQFKRGLAQDSYNFWKSVDYRSNYERTVEENLAAYRVYKPTGNCKLIHIF